MKMKKLVLLPSILLFTVISFSDWTVDKGHSKVAFIVNHHGISEVDGYFKKYDVVITTEKEDLSDLAFDVKIETASITTDLEPRDNHLKSADIFDVEKFPAMTFKSTSLKKIKGNEYKMTGQFTLKGTTKEITLDVTMNGPVENPNKNAKNFQVGIKALGTIKRSDFKLGERLPVAFVSDEVQIRVTGEFNKPNPAAQ
jgi:polyisoprenoid-binding protein YceI